MSTRKAPKFFEKKNNFTQTTFIPQTLFKFFPSLFYLHWFPSLSTSIYTSTPLVSFLLKKETTELVPLAAELEPAVAEEDVEELVLDAEEADAAYSAPLAVAVLRRLLLRSPVSADLTDSRLLCSMSSTTSSPTYICSVARTKNMFALIHSLSMIASYS